MTLPIAVLFLQLLIPTRSIPAVAAITRTVELDTNTKPEVAATTVPPSMEATEPAPVFRSTSSMELPRAPGQTNEDVVAAASGSALPSKSPLQEPSQRLRYREWLALSISGHGAAAFDAWSTRRVVASGEGQESNALLRPFAGNGSIYAATQVGPVVFDYVSRRMMKSQRGWARHTWWILQAASTAASFASGAHNLSIR